MNRRTFLRNLLATSALVAITPKIVSSLELSESWPEYRGQTWHTPLRNELIAREWRDWHGRRMWPQSNDLNTAWGNLIENMEIRHSDFEHG